MQKLLIIFNKPAFFYTFLIICFALMIFLRVIYLNADAPAATLAPKDGVFLTDEGWWSHNAVNKVLFGKWTVDEFNPFYITPLFTILQFLFFSVLGVSFISARLLDVLFGLLTTLLLFQLVRDQFKTNYAVLAMLLLGFNYIFIMYNRLAILETPMVFFLLLSFYFWQKGIKSSRSLNYVFSGISFFLAYLIKPTALLFIIIYFIANVIILIKNKQIINVKAYSPLAYFLLGLIPLVIVWLSLFILPNFAQWDFCNSIYIGEKLSISPINQIFNFLNFFDSLFFKQNLLLSILSLIFVFIYSFKLLFTKSKLDPISIFTLIWLIIGSLFLSFFKQQHTRYFLIILPPICIATIIIVKDFLKSNQIQFTLKQMKISTIYALCCLIFTNLIFSLKYLNISSLNLRLMIFLATTFCLVFLIIVYKTIKNKNINFKPSQNFKYSILIILTCFYLTHSGLEFYKWADNPQFSLQKAAKIVQEKAGKKAIITGEMANTLALENNLRTVTYVGKSQKTNLFTMALEGNDEKEWLKYKPTHIVSFRSGQNNNLPVLRKMYPKTFKSAIILNKFRIMDNYYTKDYIYFYKI